MITVTTTYPGASADLIQGFITSPIAASVSTTENIDYVTSQSRPSASVVTVQMRLGSNPDAALTEVIAKVNQVRSQLPTEAEDPVIVKGTGQQFAIMYLAMQNPNMTGEQLTEYIERVIRPRLSTIEGVAEIQIFGAKNYSMRVWSIRSNSPRAGSPHPSCSTPSTPRTSSPPPERPRTNTSFPRSPFSRRCRRRRPSRSCR